MSVVFLAGFDGAVFAQDADIAAQDADAAVSSGVIPEDLRRPRLGEAVRLPVDTVIGPLGRGEADEEAYEFASRVAADLTAADAKAASLAGVNSVSREGFISALGQASVHTYRLGGGRAEDDGAVSFLARFIGREQAITAELFIRPRESGEEGETRREWVFEDLILEAAQTRGEENERGEPRFDFAPYERFF